MSYVKHASVPESATGCLTDPAVAFGDRSAELVLPTGVRMRVTLPLA
ncbi:MAG: hypothetical protein IT467_02585 [Dokdonella sp.]|nr:hypothetical protein [Dokdonella sp.]MBZ0222597.1 hypothetical protein [Dokdonella sp.]MCC7254798.1 hypothetical protein [Dokdonella sp.]